MTTTPLAVLDLVPVAAGSTAADALRNSIDLARRAERLGYARYWFAEHHLNPGVAGTAPAVLLALVAARTATIRLGSGALLMGHRTALSAVEEFGLLDAAHPGRFDLGLGRSGPPRTRPPGPAPTGTASPGTAPAGTAPTGTAPSGTAPSGTAPSGTTPTGPPDRVAPPAGSAERVAVPAGAAARAPGSRTPEGLLVPPPFRPAGLLSSPRFALQHALLHGSQAQPPDYAEQVRDVLAFLAGTYRSVDGVEAHVVPGEHADLQVWILGSSGGESAEVAGAHGLRFAANYHVSPGTVLEAVAGYRQAFVPSGALDRPYVSVSADVVVAPAEGTARELASGYGPWVRSIRRAEGAIPFPDPDRARALRWTDADRELVADRVDTQFVGTPAQVADSLERLRDATGADELVVTTITHRHADRVRSYELLAEEWARR